MIRIFAALLLLTGAAQAAELRIATWNLEWLTGRPAGDPALPEDVRPKRSEDIDSLRRYALTLDADVIAFQEVDGPEMAARIFPTERYAILITADDVVQRVGFAVRRGIAVRHNPDLAGLDVLPGATHRLRSGADITLDLPGARLRLLAVHLKTGCNHDRLSSVGGGSISRTCETLHRQVAPLQGWIAQRREEGMPFVLLGDFNRRMDGRDELLAALTMAAPLTRATEGRASPCWGGGSFIDHILAGGAARSWVVPDSLRVMVYRETGEAAKEHLSDHCPVFVRFRLPD
jgi:endonuclease/exonuclease/phosphatase family metal-dependent hydrolase